ncbi:hypothetical protein C8J56DRAFT_886669 [Mycena floridula]|nr:hypothetical protein C8J56DRAFT_886669 [Mycena floridula]
MPGEYELEYGWRKVLLKPWSIQATGRLLVKNGLCLGASLGSTRPYLKEMLDFPESKRLQETTARFLPWVNLAHYCIAEALIGAKSQLLDELHEEDYDEATDQTMQNASEERFSFGPALQR